MKLGALLGPIKDPANPRWLQQQAQRLVAEGYESLWTAQAIGRGFMFSDPFSTLAVAASVTERVPLGAAVVQAPLYSVVDLAHRIASLHQLCGDRLIMGLGAGSTESDFIAFGRDYDQRFNNLRQGVKGLRTLLSGGKHAHTSLDLWPSVVGGPPLFLGSWGKGVSTAAQSYDGWIASAHYRTPEEVVSAMGRGRAAGGGRAVVSTIETSAQTDLGELRANLDQFAAAGFDDAVILFAQGAPDPAQVRKLLG